MEDLGTNSFVSLILCECIEDLGTNIILLACFWRMYRAKTPRLTKLTKLTTLKCWPGKATKPSADGKRRYGGANVILGLA